MAPRDAKRRLEWHFVRYLRPAAQAAKYRLCLENTTGLLTFQAGEATGSIPSAFPAF
jgi:hypothetical protein